MLLSSCFLITFRVLCFAALIICLLYHIFDVYERVLENEFCGFRSYYDDRISRGLPPEKKNCIFFRDEVYIDDVENLIIKMPFKRFSDMGFIEYSSVDGIMTLNKTIFAALDYQKIAELVVHCDETLNKYWDK